MKDLKWFVAQTTADIESINTTVVELQARIEALRAEEIELKKVLKKLEK